jgi:hypothetical protein
VVSANRVPDGAETAPLEQPDEPSATSAREGEEALSTEAYLVISRSKRVKHDMLVALPTGNVEITLCHPYSAIGSARDQIIYPSIQGLRTGARITGPATITSGMLSIWSA